MPLLLSTWPFGMPANEAAIPILRKGGTAMDAVVEAATYTELSPDVNSVGRFSKPNAAGELQLDAAVMDAATGRCGAVGALEAIPTATRVAREVMRDGRHVFLAGAGATQFALQHGFTPERLVDARGLAWLEEHEAERCKDAGHDTIGVIAIDTHGALATACTTSGLGGKLPGRVGDSPMIGAGLYCDSEIGACVGTGHGEDILKVCASFLVVERMRLGATPQQACEEAVVRMVDFARRGALTGDEPLRRSAVLACTMNGEIGAAATVPGFEYACWDGNSNVLKKAPNWEEGFRSM